ncbi:MAG TPA: helix-turn-helix transcriptional regulator [Polyangiaceae bacterium]
MDSEPIVGHIAHEAGACDCSFDVACLDKKAGLVKAARFLEPSHDPKRYVGRPVSEILHAIGCGAAEDTIRAALEKASPEVVQAFLPDGGVFRVITVAPAEGAVVRVTVRCLDAHLLPDLVDAKVARVAETNGLSDRERQVLRLLLRGRGVEDIATMLEIAPRTVKFHQANVLQKLGADSRLDLLRVVL